MQEEFHDETSLVTGIKRIFRSRTTAGLRTFAPEPDIADRHLARAAGDKCLESRASAYVLVSTLVVAGYEASLCFAAILILICVNGRARRNDSSRNCRLHALPKLLLFLAREPAT
ncbi:MAG: hypothetical protein ABI790_05630 [Betaproteobacteria bacterium]